VWDIGGDINKHKTGDGQKMKRLILSLREKKIPPGAIWVGAGVTILLLILLGVRLYSNKVVVTAANKEEININTETKHEDNVNNSLPKQPEEVKKDEPKEIKPEEKKEQKANPQTNTNEEKSAYLTFDDGPNGKLTPQVLEVLKQYNVKATFFVTGKAIENNKDILLREKQEGHAIGNHTYCHDYKYLYSSTSAFLQDLAKNDALIRSVVGDYNNKLIRFPGGSFDKNKSAMRQAVTEAGYHYVDWNCLNGDAETASAVPVEKLVEKVKQTSQGKNRLVILMHDAGGKETTVQALPQIIEYLKAQGYNFKTLE